MMPECKLEAQGLISSSQSDQKLGAGCKGFISRTLWREGERGGGCVWLSLVYTFIEKRCIH
jgi:hypothetical protein